MQAILCVCGESCVKQPKEMLLQVYVTADPQYKARPRLLVSFIA